MLYDIIIPEPFLSFHVLCDCVTITVTCVTVVIVIYDIILNFFCYLNQQLII